MFERIAKKNIKLLSCLYRILCGLIRPQDNKICFLSEPDVSDNSYHYFRHLSASVSGKKYIWIVKNTDNAQKKIGNNKNVSIVRRKSIRSIYELISSRYIFHTHGTYQFVTPNKKRTIVNLWHGMPIKNVGLLDMEFIKSGETIDRSDYIICTSKFFSYVMACAYNVEYQNSLITGLPRNDALLTDNISKTTFYKKLGVELNCKVGFWLPTYRKMKTSERQDSTSESFLSELNFNLSDLDAQLGKLEIVIFIKIHPLDAFHYPASKYLNIRFLTQSDWEEINIDLYDALSHTSFLVSDISSVMIDYMITGKPIIQIDPTSNGYHRGATYEYNFGEYKNFYKTRSEDEFLLSINKPKIISPPPYTFHSSTGNASENLTKIIFRGE